MKGRRKGAALARRNRDVSCFAGRAGRYVARATLFFFIIPLTAIALNYRGASFHFFFSFFVKSEKEDESKIHLKKLCAGRGEASAPLVEPTFAKVPSP